MERNYWNPLLNPADEVEPGSEGKESPQYYSRYDKVQYTAITCSRSAAHSLSKQQFTLYEDVKTETSILNNLQDQEIFPRVIRTLPERGVKYSSLSPIEACSRFVDFTLTRSSVGSPRESGEEILKRPNRPFLIDNGKTAASKGVSETPTSTTTTTTTATTNKFIEKKF
ncbi:unnamed protein product [Ceratitis capitata]|uniref:(Mediterranean fruit fly) hypothetical protein n=1 Tax=Ceratitis capitata TaxID=7213 RepID=A0A811UK56_CERCA|nr:unnamed protein product [Ceratitis capitata]